ncbi:uncharacterized protein [Periplaneta americana]|uniref:uncharacterized protein n=1 Tax=Periplaneta americana TaxID=6978 RepID=UPI0037E7E8AA
MSGKVWILFLLTMALPDYILCFRIDEKVEKPVPDKEQRIIGSPPPGSNRCASRIENRMQAMKKMQQSDKRDPSNSNNALLDLAGYALHQPMKTAPYDMYVTNMRVHVPTRAGWFRVEKCFYDPYNASVDTRLMFHDLKVSGMVKLYDEKAVLQDPLLPLPMETCNMTLRLRQAGLGIAAFPLHISRGAGNIELRMSSQFIKPEFVSVYAYGCHPPSREHRANTNNNAPSTVARRQVGDFTQEMEDVFVRGIQSLLTRYFEKQLQPALKDTVMANMGYTISYGK